MVRKRAKETDQQSAEQIASKYGRGFFNQMLILFILLTQIIGFVLVIMLLGIIAYRYLQQSHDLPDLQTLFPQISNELRDYQGLAFLSRQLQPDELAAPIFDATATSTASSTITLITQNSTATATITATPKIQTATHDATRTPTATEVISNLSDAIGLLCSPIEGIELDELQAIISQEYNVPNQFSDIGHHGVDLGSYNYRGRYLYDVPIMAIMSGQVAGVVHDRPPLGNAIILETSFEQSPEKLRLQFDIQPGESIYHLYAHLLNDPNLAIGSKVACGEEINRLGKSQTVEAHLHLETRIGASAMTISGMAFYDTSATEEELAEYLWWRTSGDFLPVDPMIIFVNLVD